MTLELIRNVLGWCAVVNLGLLVWWLLFVLLARDWTYRVHSKWFRLPRKRFDAIHYAGRGMFKMLIFFFNVVLYFALQIVG